ncbi:HAD-like protein [Hesseltinella vesiculosa]|uniref:HAD-like protein n=1 Tax=Hesseltinella vesiculosa TaxID=101127 RepID=A0A1X2G714_9FUNG|nr:HAD-like protein [Hesseltinella vesiculosa]
MVIKAVIFDMGGVCVGSPMTGIHKYELAHNLPRNYINVAIVHQGEQGAFQQLERGELTLRVFYKKFGEQLSDPKNKHAYQAYLKKSGKPPMEHIPDIHVDGEELFVAMMKEAQQEDPVVVGAIKQLRASGRFIVAALTNNYNIPEEDKDAMEKLGGGSSTLPSLFDHYIESRVVGLRKPDPRIYELACKTIGIAPTEAVFLDDIGMNLRAANKLGMQTIQVQIGKSKDAIKQLGQLVNMDLLNESRL